MQPEDLIHTILAWATSQPGVEAMALVGSHARGTARADSDIDLVLLVRDPAAFRADTGWLEAALRARPMRWRDEDYGALWSRRVWVAEGDGEIEFGFAAVAWGAVDPIDAGTRRVVGDGCRILYDPGGVLGRLCVAVGG
jgi:hypothetical protein